jgi:hypothetical protein
MCVCASTIIKLLHKSIKLIEKKIFIKGWGLTSEEADS